MYGAAGRIRTTALVAGLCLVVLGGGSTGCGAAPVSNGGISPPPPSPPPAAVTIPADGVSLGAFGLTNGPVEAFSLPRTTVVTAVVDQPNAVSLVISRPPATELYAYLQRALPSAGFTVTDSAAAARTLTFTGRGWSGSFTADARASAVLLRPV